MGLDPKWVKIASYLARGDFTLIYYISEDIPYLRIPDYGKKYQDQVIGILQGVCGVISCNYNPSKYQVLDEFMQDLYDKLYLNTRADDSYSKSIDTNVLQIGNYRNYAIY